MTGAGASATHNQPMTAAATTPAATPEPIMSKAADAIIAPAPPRLVSLDAYRGFVMFLMVAEVLHLSRMARAFPESGFWAFLAHQQSHVEWIGCTLHDLIQPSFTFMVGVAIPFSIASRVAKGQAFGTMVGHAIWRSLLLIFLGIFLRSVGRPMTNFTFEDTLTQIGLGYTFAFLLAFARSRTQWIALALILLGYWAAWALYPLPPANFNWQSVGVPADWQHLTGFAAHWDKNWNLGTAFDQWFMNLFPREKPFLYNGGGYLTLSFIPTLGTMLFGLLAGQWLRTDRTAPQKALLLVKAGLICLAVGVAVHFAGLNPIVKRIWTPSWTLYSAGWCFLLLAGFYSVIDMRGHRAWAFPLVVIGMNSIFIYCISHLIDGFIIGTYKTHFGQDFFNLFGTAYAPIFTGAVVILTFWLLLYWMYRRKIFLRI
jgi:heparan-alpha-glucosaminide N-acetyltransferase